MRVFLNAGEGGWSGKRLSFLEGKVECVELLLLLLVVLRGRGQWTMGEE